MSKNETKWVKADSTFIERYHSWKQQKQQNQTLSILEKSKVPKLQSKQTVPEIKRKGMLATTKLSLISKNSNNEESYRLDGDLMEYLMELEAQNTNLQSQLEVALLNLRGSDLTHQKILMESKNQNDKLAREILEAMRRINEQSSLHSKEKEMLMTELEELQKQVGKLCTGEVVAEKGESELLRKRVSQISMAADDVDLNTTEPGASGKVSPILEKTSSGSSFAKFTENVQGYSSIGSSIENANISGSTISSSNLNQKGGTAPSAMKPTRNHAAPLVAVPSRTESLYRVPEPTSTIVASSETDSTSTQIMSSKSTLPSQTTNTTTTDIANTEIKTLAKTVATTSASQNIITTQTQMVAPTKDSNHDIETQPLLTPEQNTKFNQLITENTELESLILETNQTISVLDIQQSNLNTMQNEIHKAVSRVSSVMSLRQEKGDGDLKELQLENEGLDMDNPESSSLIPHEEFQW